MQIQLNPSKFFLGFFLLAFIGGEVSIFCSDLSLVWQVISSLLLGIYASKLLGKTVLLRDKRAVVSLFCSDDNSWQIKEYSGAVYQARLLPETAINRLFCLLRFQLSANEKRGCVVFKDAVRAKSYRQLIMKLAIQSIEE